MIYIYTIDKIGQIQGIRQSRQIRLDQIRLDQVRLDQIRLDRKIDRQIDRYIDGWIDRQMDGWLDGQIDRQVHIIRMQYIILYYVIKYYFMLHYIIQVFKQIEGYFFKLITFYYNISYLQYTIYDIMCRYNILYIMHVCHFVV